MHQSKKATERVVESGMDDILYTVGVKVDGVLSVQRLKVDRALHKDEHPVALEKVVDAPVVDDILHIGPPTGVNGTAQNALHGLGSDWRDSD